MRVAVVFGGSSPEAPISRKSAESVIKALKDLGYSVFPIELSENFIFELKKVSPDKVFLVLHGSPGEDGTVQGLLEISGFPYTGCGVETSAVCMDKDLTKRVLKTYGIPVPAGETYFKGDKVELKEIPCVVKPARAGSTLGVSLVFSEDEFDEAVRRAFSYDSKIIVEEYVDGRELTVGVLNGKVLPIVEIVVGGGFYDYDSKYKSESTRYEVPARLPEKTEKRIKDLAEKVYKVLECKGAVRIDFRLSNLNIPYVLEVNTIPGLTERSLLPKAAEASGITFKELIKEMLEA